MASLSDFKKRITIERIDDKKVDCTIKYKRRIYAYTYNVHPSGDTKHFWDLDTRLLPKRLRLTDRIKSRQSGGTEWTEAMCYEEIYKQFVKDLKEGKDNVKEREIDKN